MKPMTVNQLRQTKSAAMRQDEPFGLRAIAGARLYSGRRQADWMELAAELQRAKLVTLKPGRDGSGTYADVVLTEVGHRALALG